MDTQGRRLWRSAISWTLPVVLLALIFTTGFTLVVNNSARVKQIVRDSGLYTTFMDAMVAQAAESNSGTIIATIPVEQPEIQSIIHEAFPPATLALHGNQIIDGTYDWLRGEANLPTFSIDLSVSKQRLATGLAAYVQQRLATLPLCADTTSAATFNPFTSGCVPRGLDSNSTVQTIQQQLAASPHFLAEPLVTANTFTDRDGKPLIASSSHIPQTYQHILGLPVLMGILAVILVVVSLIVADDRHRQYNRLALLCIGSGTLAIAVSFVASKTWQQFGTTFIQSTLNENQILLEQSLSIINTLNSALTRDNIVLSLIVIAAGVVLFVIGRTASHSGMPLGRILAPVPSNVSSANNGSNKNGSQVPPATISKV